MADGVVRQPGAEKRSLAVHVIFPGVGGSTFVKSLKTSPEGYAGR